MSRTLSADGTVRTPYDPDALPLLRAAPGARWDRNARVWRWSVAPGDLPRALELADKLQLDVDPSLRERVVAGTEETRAADARITMIEGAAGCALYPFQRTGVHWLALKQRALLADDMGLGKTIQVLAALPAQARALVVCPASLKLNWRAECLKWRPDLRPVVLAGKGSFRWPESGELVIINYDLLPKATKSTVRGQPNTMAVPAAPSGVTLVLDECHAVKNWKAARSLAAKTLGQLVSGAGGTIWYLSGTPLLTRPTDLFGVLEALGDRSLGSWVTFVDLFHGSKNRWGGWEFGHPRPEVAERLRRIMLRRRKTEVLPDLPRKVRADHWVNGLGKDLAGELDGIWAGLDDDDRTGDDLPDFREFSGALARLAEARIPAMLDLIAEYEEAEEPLVVFSAHRAPIDILGGREGWRVITGDTPAAQRQEAIEAFQDGRLKGIGCTIQAGGVGITLTRASKVLFVDRDWTPALNLQAEDRVCRIGQTADSIQVTVMRSDHPLCRHLDALIERKLRMIEAAVEHETAGLSQEHVAAVEARAAAIQAAAARSEKTWAEQTVIRRADGIAARTANYIERALTPECVAWMHSAIEQLAGACDGAVARDDSGFNKCDTALGKALAMLPDWSEAQARVAARLCTIYRRQIGSPPERIAGSTGRKIPNDTHQP